MVAEAATETAAVEARTVAEVAPALLTSRVRRLTRLKEAIRKAAAGEASRIVEARREVADKGEEEREVETARMSHSGNRIRPLITLQWISLTCFLEVVRLEAELHKKLRSPKMAVMVTLTNSWTCWVSARIQMHKLRKTTLSL